MLKTNYLSNLNEKQQEAVLHLDGPLLIVAGLVREKPKVLTSRIAHIIRSHKAFSNQILAVTFTNKASKEMQTRVSKLLKREATGLPWLRHISFNKCKNSAQTCGSCWIKVKFYNYRSR